MSRSGIEAEKKSLITWTYRWIYNQLFQTDKRNAVQAETGKQNPGTETIEATKVVVANEKLYVNHERDSLAPVWRKDR